MMNRQCFLRRRGNRNSAPGQIQPQRFPFFLGKVVETQPLTGPIFGIEARTGRITLRISMSCRTLFRTLLALSGSLFIVSCTEYQTRPPTAVAPAPTPAGYWNGD